MELLYHYTNIESLALILSNKTIRFNSLDNVDDLTEKQTADIRNFGQFFYVSSWTEDKRESIPMWKMYGSLEEGVRIALPKYPFYEYTNDLDSFGKTGMTVEKDDDGVDYLKSIIPFADSINAGFISYPYLQKDMLFKVEYTDDKDKLFPTLISKDEDTIQVATNLIGKYKSYYWEFQKEWRYIFYAFPIDLKKLNPQYDAYLNYINSKLLSGNLSHPFDHYDLTISDDSFKKMEIMLGPKISKGNSIIVKNLVKEYNPDATLEQSSLFGKI